jgi:hypothetical protein
MRGVPTFEEPELTRFLEDVVNEFTNRDKDKLYSSKANHSILLLSPNKKTYEIKVSDAGILVATLVQG